MTLAAAASSAVAAWNLDEASGNRADQVGTNTLTDHNSTGSASGVFSNAATFNGSNQWLTVADNATVSTGNIDFMVRCWVNLTSKAANRAVISHWGDFSNRCFLLFYDAGADRFCMFLRTSSGVDVARVNADTLGSPSTGVWYLLHGWHDATHDSVGIAVNAGTADTAATGGAAPVDSGALFAVGATDEGPANLMNGLIDDVVLLKSYILDATERTEDYNSGAGVAYSAWSAGAAGQPTGKRWGGIPFAASGFVQQVKGVQAWCQRREWRRRASGLILPVGV